MYKKVYEIEREKNTKIAQRSKLCTRHNEIDQKDRQLPALPREIML